MTHTSWINERGAEGRDNERLEYLGDAVLELVAAEYLFNRFPNYDEGQLTQMRSSLVSTVALAGIGEQLRLGEALRLGRGATKSGARRLVSLHANAFEALIGATFLDQGYRKAGKIFLSRIGDLSSWTDPNFKGRLQALAQERFGKPPLYQTLADGNARPRQYLSKVSVEAGPVLGEGRGGTKQAAEQGAARAAIDSLVAPVSKKRRRGPRPVAAPAVPSTGLGTLPTVAADIPLPTPPGSAGLDAGGVAVAPASSARKRRRRSRGGTPGSPITSASESIPTTVPEVAESVDVATAGELPGSATTEAQPARRRRRRSRGKGGASSTDAPTGQAMPTPEPSPSSQTSAGVSDVPATATPDPARRRRRRPRGGSPAVSGESAAPTVSAPTLEAPPSQPIAAPGPESSPGGEDAPDASERKRTHRGRRGGRRRSGRPATPTP